MVSPCLAAADWARRGGLAVFTANHRDMETQGARTKPDHRVQATNRRGFEIAWFEGKAAIVYKFKNAAPIGAGHMH